MKRVNINKENNTWSLNRYKNEKILYNWEKRFIDIIKEENARKLPRTKTYTYKKQKEKMNLQRMLYERLLEIIFLRRLHDN